MFAPLPGARDPYTGRRLRRPYPGVVITTGSIQGSERMYWWLAQDLAERGYVVLTYDVQGQGTSETLPHENDQVNALPFCNPLAPPGAGEDFGCPGVPAQQDSNFVYGTQDALSFFLSTPRPYRNRYGGDTQVNSFNPLWRLFDRSRDRRTATPGRTQARGDHRPLARRLGGLVRAGRGPPRRDGRGARQAERGRGRLPRAAGREARRAGAGGAVGVRLQRPAVLDAARLLDPAEAGPAERGARPAPRGEHGLRRLAGRRRRLDARRAARLDPPRVHRHRLRAAREPLRPGAHERVRAALARSLPQAPPHAAARSRASATSSRWTWGAGIRSSSTAPSGSASTSAPGTRSAVR